MTSAPHDKPEQLRQIQDGLLEGEQIQAVYDCTGAGTGFVGVAPDKRLHSAGQEFCRKKRGDRLDSVQTNPHSFNGVQ